MSKKKVESSDEDDSTETDGEEASGGEEEAEEDRKEIKCPHLVDRFMHYNFIWGSYVFQHEDLGHLTNGAIENFNFFAKGQERDILPHRCD